MDMKQLQTILDRLDSLSSNQPRDDQQETLEQFIKMFETADKVKNEAAENEKLNEASPVVRPYRNRQELLQRYKMHEMTMLNLNQQNTSFEVDRRLLFSAVVTGFLFFIS